MKLKILVVDDEEIVVRSCVRILRDDYEVHAVFSGLEALKKAGEQNFDIMILDVMMPGMDGMEVLQQVKERYPDMDVIMMTGLSEIQTAVKAMKLGAFDYLSKPFDPDGLIAVVQRALERRNLLRQNALPASDVATQYRFENIIGTSPAMQSVFGLIAKCAPTNTTVLITGESGTGKEMIARAIHYNSLRKEEPFVTVDCNTLSENLLESELFGHAKGSFTGAVTSKRGMFETANNGTLFLDEFGNIPLTTQAKLLRVIQEREFRQVGSTTVQKTNVRLLVATNKDLKAMVAEGTFREDLYYRVNVFPIHAPPLRDRLVDIPALAMHFLKLYCSEMGRPVAEISEGAMRVLMHHHWPGNVRELENTMQRALILCNAPLIRQAHLDTLLAMVPNVANVPRTGEELKRLKKLTREKSVEDVEKAFVVETLRRNGSSVTRSAEETGMQRTNFQALMKKYNIKVRDTEHEGDAGDAD